MTEATVCKEQAKSWHGCVISTQDPLLPPVSSVIVTMMTLGRLGKKASIGGCAHHRLFDRLEVDRSH
jgi:hypothetical protein